MITILVLQTKTEATFYIEKFDIKSEVLENGDMLVEENITYSSTEIKNGVTRNIVLENDRNDKNSATSFQLQEVLVDGVTAQRVSSGTLGQDKAYEYAYSKKKAFLKVYMPFNRTSNKRTVTYRYLLSNVAVKYNDTAEIFWNFIGKEWDTAIQNVHIQITLPEQAANNTSYVYGHGSDNGRFTKEGNVINLYATGLKANQALDARILFARDSVPTSLKVVNKNVLDKYQKQEEGMSRKQEDKTVIGELTVKQIAIIFSAMIVLTGCIIYIKYDKEEKVEKFHYYRDIPNNLEPEVIQTVYFQKVQKDSFFIAFLNLIKKGVYTITNTTNEVGKETKLITYQKGIRASLEDYEKKVKDTINGFMEKGENSITLLTLNQKMKRNTGSGYRKFKEKLEGKMEELFGEETKTPNTLGRVLTMVMILLIIIIAVIGYQLEGQLTLISAFMLGFTAFIYTMVFKSIQFNVFTILFLLVHFSGFQIGNIMMLEQIGTIWLYIPYLLLFALIQYTYRVKKYPKEQRQMREQIKGLRRYIKDYSYLDERGEINELNLWEDYFILAIALKLNKKIVDYFYGYCKDMEGNMGNSLREVGSYYIMSTAVASGFNTYTKAASTYSRSSGGSSSSYSGSSGGFSGGSSSGGGGRRWRWRKFVLKSQLGILTFNIFTYIIQKVETRKQGGKQ